MSYATAPLGDDFWTVAFWIFVVAAMGGWMWVGDAVRWLWYHLPANRRRRDELRAQRELREIQEWEQQLLEDQRQAERDAEHALSCGCGERCDGRARCEDHHPECNCDHLGSFCVCEDEDLCGCGCRCDCKSCDGYYRQVTLHRIPHSDTRPSERAAPGKPARKAEPTAQPVAAQRRVTTSENAAEPVAAEPGTSWSTAREQFMKICELYATYECDPEELVRLPALADVTFGPTGRFVEAFFEANQLLTDTEPDNHLDARAFVAAAHKAGNAWHYAVAAAERVRDTRLDDDEKVLLRQARSSLKLARNAGTAGERVSAQDKAGRVMRELDARTSKSGRWRLPEQARLEIQTWSRPELGAGEFSAESGGNRDGGSGVDCGAASVCEPGLETNRMSASIDPESGPR